MARVKITRRLEWDSAHRILRHESKCATLHGHRYTTEITISAPKLDDVGRVVDFGVVKDVVGSWIDTNWDHTTLVNFEDESLRKFCEGQAPLGQKSPYIFDFEPTAENLALFLAEMSQELLMGVNTKLLVEKVVIWETPNCSSEWNRT